MKKSLLFNLGMMILVLGACTSVKPVQIGKFTMIANRNIDSKADYVLLRPYGGGNIEAEIKKSRFATMDEAIDNTVKLVAGGEFLKNVKIYMVEVHVSRIDKNDESKYYFAVEGDVWGLKGQELPIGTYQGLKVGDRVQWRVGGIITFGTVTGVDRRDLKKFIVKPDNKKKYKKIKDERLIQINQVSTPVENSAITNPVNENKTNFKVGDYVMFKDGNTGDFIKGEITTLSQNVAFVAYPDPINPDKMKEVGKDLSQITKINKPVAENKTQPQINDVKPILVGDSVFFKKLENTPQIKGKVIKINLNMATIEYTDPANINKLREIEIDINKLIKTEK